MLVILEPGRQKQEEQEFKVRLLKVLKASRENCLQNSIKTKT